MRVVILLVMLIFMSAGYAETLYVKSKVAKLRKHPRKKKTIKKAKRGTKLTKIKKVRKWIRVKYQGKKLWIYKGKVSKRKPKSDASLLTANYAEDVAAGSAVRGLSDIALKFSNSNSIKEKHKTFMDFHQSYITTDKKDFIPQITSRKVELIKITLEMLEKFQEDGNIGAYANAGDDSEFEEE